MTIRKKLEHFLKIRQPKQHTTIAPQSSHIKCNGLEIILSRKRIKNLNLRIDRDGTVKLSAPFRYPIADIQQFIESKQAWILRHKNRILVRPQHAQPQFQTGEMHFFLGKSYPLLRYEQAQQALIHLESNQITYYMPEHFSFPQQQKFWQRWHRTQMQAFLVDLIKKWEPVLNVHVKEWGIKTMKTRWGSCHTTQQKIWINLLLIHEPFHCLEYVVVHEMVHLLEPSHNARFYALMTEFLPNWQVSKRYLRDVSIRP